MTARCWHALELRVPPAAAEIAAAGLWEFPLTGLQEDADDPGCLTAFADSPWDEDVVRVRAAAWVRRALGDDAPPPRVRVYRVEDEDWQRRWKESWRPTPLGASLVVVPAWWSAPAAGRTEVRIDPGRAFGTGTHISTALAWELLEPVLEEGGATRLLDLGTGSGVLALGARRRRPDLEVVATDADAEALASARGNLPLNPDAGPIHLVRTDRFPFAPGSFDLAVANLTAAEQALVEDGWPAVLAPGGLLVLAGLRTDQAETLSTRWAPGPLVLEGTLSREGWTALRWRRLRAPAQPPGLPADNSSEL